MLFGPSQAGKSSFINALSDRHLTEEGDGAGISKTTKCKDFSFVDPDGSSVVILDVPGLGDNFNNVSDDQILEGIRRKILDYLAALILETGEQRVFIDGILIFEPLDTDFSAIGQTMVEAELLFGPSVYESGLVVFTKGDLEFARRPDVQQAQKLDLPFCQWQSYGIEQQHKTANWEFMKAELAKLAPYHVERMDQVLEEVRVLAMQACENQPPTYMTVQIPVTRQVQTGTRPVEVKRQKTPVELFRTEEYTVTEQIVLREASTYEQLRMRFAERVIDRIIVPFGCGRQPAQAGIFLAAGACATVYMKEHAHKSSAQLRNELRAIWPWGSSLPHSVPVHYQLGGKLLKWILQESFFRIIESSKDLGCGEAIIKMAQTKKTRQIPYMHVEEVVEVVQEPVYEVVIEMEPHQELAPKRPEEEFMDEARSLKASLIRGQLQAK